MFNKYKVSHLVVIGYPWLLFARCELKDATLCYEYTLRKTT